MRRFFALLSFRTIMTSGAALLLVVLTFSIPQFIAPVDAQTVTTYQCDTPDQKAACTALLSQTEQEIANLGTQLASKAQEGSSLSHDKAVLDLQIQQAQLKIKARELDIANLGKDITAKTDTITTLSGKIDNGKDAMSQIISQTNDIDNLSIAEAFLSNKSLTNFFIDLDTFSSIRSDLQTKLTAVQQDKQLNQTQKDQLSAQRDTELGLKKQIEDEQAKIKTAEAEKQRLLALNQNEQQNYQTQISNKQVEATKIRNALFALRDTAAIKFGDAVAYAKAASAATGVRAAFILGIIQQESNLGANVGQCYLSDASGNGIRKSTGEAVTRLMKASRDVQPFFDITKSLGLDPFKTVVSCPLDVGYGGAMGPAQFIPSTWVLISQKIQSATGKSTSNPWDPQDAFMASALYLSDRGASGGQYSSELAAACKYYGSGGSTCAYGRSVMSRADAIQANIDILANSQ